MKSVKKEEIKIEKKAEKKIERKSEMKAKKKTEAKAETDMDMENEIEIGTLLRYYRKCRSLTQKQIAENAAINEKYYGRIERNESTPTVGKFFILCKVMKVEPAQFCYALSEKKKFQYLVIERKEKPPYAVSRGNVHLITDFGMLDNLFEELYYAGGLEGYSIYGNEIQKMFGPYKDAFYFPRENLMVENSGVISEAEHAVYPADGVGIIKERLEFVKEKLQENCKVNYNIFILRPNIHTLSWNGEIRELFEEVQKNGMRVMPYYLYYEDGILKAQAVELVMKENSYMITFKNMQEAFS